MSDQSPSQLGYMPVFDTSEPGADQRPPYQLGKADLPTHRTSMTSTLAIFSLVSGILSIYPFVVIGSVVAVITGYLAQREIKESGDTISGRKLATAGLAIGTVTFVLWLLLVCAVAVFRVTNA